MMKTLIAFLSVVSVLMGQDGSPTNSSKGVPYKAYEGLYYYSGANLIYACYAPSYQPGNNASTKPPSTITVSAASNANPVSFTATAHGFGDFVTLGPTSTPVVKITGYTGNWAALNGVWSVIVTSANAFTIAVDSTAFGAVTGTAVFTTYSPLWNKPVWSIQTFVYSGANLIFSGWATSNPGAGNAALGGGVTGANFSCSSRASYGYQ